MTRPNILFLMSDEHRADVTGYEGNRVIRTPFLNELAATGVVFRNAYAPSPICIPGRQAMMAGQLPRTCGCERFGEDLAPGYMTFARRFSQFAYATLCAGKLHHTGVDQMQGWTERVAADARVDARHIEGRDEASFAALEAPPRGWKWSDAEEVQKARHDTASQNQTRDRFALEAAQEAARKYFVDMTLDRATPDRSLLLKLSLIQPHYPYVTEPERMLYYFNRVTPYLDEPVFDHPFLSTRQVRPGVDATEREIRRATAAYYGMVESVDAHCAGIARTLEQIGQNLDDWIIVYVSDHGEMLGEHGVWEKQKFFEGSARVPLIIRWPARFEPRVVEENVNLCDLFATLCELADIPLPETERGLDSRSLVPLMSGDTRKWHERYHNETVSQFRGTNLMIKRGDLKYHSYDPDLPEVLFDLATDPAERRNCIDDPAYAGAVETFRRRRAELGFGPQADPDYRNAGYGAS